MKNKAIAKITDEMMKLDNSFAQFIEEYLTSICTTDAVAEKLLDPEKSLKTFVTEIIKEQRKIARGQGTGTQVVGAPDTYFYEKVEAYYDITEADKSSMATTSKKDIIDITDFL